MYNLLSSVGAAALLCVSSAPVSAAPDNTLGAALLSAVVAGNGALARGSGVSSAGGSLGQYSVTFDRDVTDCVYTAVIGAIQDSFADGVVDVTSTEGNTNGVTVRTRDFSGTLTAKPFHLLVFCAR